MRTLQIATTGFNTDSVSMGIRNFPVDKLNLICLHEEREPVEQLQIDLVRVMKIPVEIFTIQTNIFEEMLTIISEINESERLNYDEVILNVAGGSKHMTCAATVAAFVNGLKAFHVMDDRVFMLPVMKLSYSEMISKPKLEVLQHLSSVGGEVESLAKLSEVSGYGKSLLSHHIIGSGDSRGLASLGLVEVERLTRGRLNIKLTTLGSLALNNP